MKRMVRWLARGIRALGRGLMALARAFKPELRDVVFFAGLGLAGAGGMMLSVPWTLILIGVALATLGKFGR